MARQTVLYAVLTVLVVMVVGEPRAHAIPAFARKYETSCQTCHVTFPKLNPFGEAFRRNGYRFPAGEDEDASRDEPVALGQDAHKKVFPDAVWPNQLPGGRISSTQLGSFVAVNHDEPKLDFSNVGGSMGINFAGTFGDTFSGWAGAAIRASATGEAEVELERVFGVIQPFSEPVLSFRVGRFEPSVSNLTIHRTLGAAPWFLTTTIGDNRFTIDPAQAGLEARGTIAAGRFEYAAGVVEGAGNVPNTGKDAYARVAYKLGGMRLDGVGGGTRPEPWREQSLLLGAFGYFGQATLGDPATATQTDRFYVGGADLALTWNDVTVYGVFSIGRNERPMLAAPAAHATTWHALGQIDYVVYPWLVPTVRYEHRSLEHDTAFRVSGGVYALAAANVRVNVLAIVEKLEESPHADLDQVLVGFNVAF